MNKQTQIRPTQAQVEQVLDQPITPENLVLVLTWLNQPEILTLLENEGSTIGHFSWFDCSDLCNSAPTLALPPEWMILMSIARWLSSGGVEGSEVDGLTSHIAPVTFEQTEQGITYEIRPLNTRFIYYLTDRGIRCTVRYEKSVYDTLESHIEFELEDLLVSI